MAQPFVLGEFISAQRCGELIAQARQQPLHWMDLADSPILSDYNRRPFLVSHRLHEHPQFSLPSLFALCRRLGPELVGCRAGVVPVDADFDTSVADYNHGLTLDEALDHLQERQAYVMVNNPERDPQFRPVVEGLLGEIAAQTEALEPGLNWFSTYLFISAQGSVTPYHMDREMNFLLQIRGRKFVQLWDPLDEEVMSPAERDLLLSYVGSRPHYKPTLDAKAMSFELAPGLGVHHPFIAPHLVRTGPELSVSLAITFRTRRSDMWTNAHRFNLRMRRLGLKPQPVGFHPVVDSTKSALITAYRRAVGVVRH